jgi:hypothetical protein
MRLSSELKTFFVETPEPRGFLQSKTHHKSHRMSQYSQRLALYVSVYSPGSSPAK